MTSPRGVSPIASNRDFVRAWCWRARARAVRRCSRRPASCPTRSPAAVDRRNATEERDCRAPMPQRLARREGGDGAPAWSGGPRCSWRPIRSSPADGAFCPKQRRDDRRARMSDTVVGPPSSGADRRRRASGYGSCARRIVETRLAFKRLTDEEIDVLCALRRRLGKGGRLRNPGARRNFRAAA